MFSLSRSCQTLLEQSVSDDPAPGALALTLCFRYQRRLINKIKFPLLSLRTVADVKLFFFLESRPRGGSCRMQPKCKTIKSTRRLIAGNESCWRPSTRVLASGWIRNIPSDWRWGNIPDHMLHLTAACLIFLIQLHHCYNPSPHGFPELHI